MLLEQSAGFSDRGGLEVIEVFHWTVEGVAETAPFILRRAQDERMKLGKF
jgi:hypothetical protein